MIYSVDTYPYKKFADLGIVKRKQGQSVRKCDPVTYHNAICAFDIETTRLPEIEQSVMYIWQMAINDDVIIGRTWEEYTQFLYNLVLHLPRETTLLIFVHNLSYEFQFLRGVYSFTEKEVFAVDKRKVLRCTMYNKRIEYRCSYLLTNMSLAEFTSKYKVKHQKLSGDDFGYSELRYPWTEITDAELEYCVNDVLGLVEALRALMESDNDNLYSLPYTSTGYVRRDVKRATNSSRQYVQSIAPEYDLYRVLRWAFRGGNTHANRFYAGKLCKNVQSWDRSSSYPDVLVNCKFPTGNFFHVGACSVDKLHDVIYRREKAAVMVVRLSNVRLRYAWWGCPYLATAKCTHITGAVYDNGRILSARMLETAITDIDYKILKNEYLFEIEILDLYHSRYGKLPKALTDTVIGYYVSKTTLKGVSGQEVYYMKSKNLLNSIYGMCATDPVKISILFRDGEFMDDPNADPEKILNKSNHKSFVAYAWGVWVTAWARLRLEEAIEITGRCFVYADTDSVKFVGKANFGAYNRARRNDSKASGSFAEDPSGEVHYMGVLEQEHTLSYFKTLGAKKYAFIEKGENKLHITVAGVGKRKGAAELTEAANGDAVRALRDYFKQGFVFNAAGGLEAIYNDVGYGKYVVDGHEIYITANVCLRPSTYTLGITGEYEQLLKLSEAEWRQLDMIGGILNDA